MASLLLTLIPVPDYVGTYGYLYNGYAVTDSRKMCPAGWHVPTFSEWKILAKYIDPVADTISNCEISCIMSIEGGKRLLSTTTLWQTPKSSDDFGFSALPAAVRAFAGHANYEIGRNASFWTTTETTFPGRAFHITLFDSINQLNIMGNTAWQNKSAGLSVRCLKD